MAARPVGMTMIVAVPMIVPMIVIVPAMPMAMMMCAHALPSGTAPRR